MSCFCSSTDKPVQSQFNPANSNQPSSVPSQLLPVPFGAYVATTAAAAASAATAKVTGSVMLLTAESIAIYSVAGSAAVCAKSLTG